MIRQPRPITPVGIVAQRLEQLVIQSEHLGLSTEFCAELRAITELAAGLEPYTNHCTSPESVALEKLLAITQAEDWNQRLSDGQTGQYLEQEMLSGQVEGQLLQILIHALKASRVLEIGMFTGYSALAMAEALPANGLVIACEIDAYAAEFAQRCFDMSAHGAKILVKVAPALQTMQELAEAGEVFDLIFIDADKAGYISYFKQVLDSHLLAPHGLICVDNTLMQGQPYCAGVKPPNGVAVAQFNQVVAADPRVQQVLLPLRDGVTLIRRL